MNHLRSATAANPVNRQRQSLSSMLVAIGLLLTLIISATSVVAQEAAEAEADGQAAPTAVVPEATFGETAPMVLMSIVKPILVLLALGGWAWCATQIDKDAAFFYLKRELINLGLLGTAALAVLAMLFIPFFFVGYPLGLLILAGGIVGYALYRNPQVPEDRRYTLSLDSFRQRMDDRQQAKAQRQATLTLFDKSGDPLPVPGPHDANYDHFHQLDSLLDFALPRKAEFLELSVDTEKAKYRVQIDGVRYARDAPEPAEAVKFIDYVKAKAGLDVEDRRRVQTGKLKIRMDDFGEKKLEVQSAGSTRGMQLKILIDPEATSDIPIEHLGFEPRQLEAVKSMAGEKGSIIIVSGGSHSGLPTTLYALLQQHDPYTSSVITLEDNMPYELEGVDHNIIEQGLSSEDLQQKVAGLLRTDPSAFYISKVTDPQIARQLNDAAEEVRVYLPLPQADTASALKTWTKAVGDPKAVSKRLGMVIAQRLMRRLCHTCRVPYTPDPAAIKTLTLPGGEKIGKLYRASGKVQVKDKEEPCPDCHGLGYRGRVGVFEVMPIDDAARDYIRKGEIDALRLHLRKQKMFYLQEAALAKVVAGITDIKEVTRAMK
jgi:type II secretory ATPase GspE/PulE/Tfp pilus assembly ATPase PilB-like protein